MVTLNANQFPEVYAKLGVKISDLGVVMLDVEPFSVTEHVDQGEADLYSSPNPDHYWIQGAIAEENAHCTLLFGLMRPGKEWQGLIDVVLDGWTPPTLEIADIGIFPSNLPGEEYACVIAHLKVTPRLLEGHARLQLLPHIDTFPLDYRPHVTLAYVKKEAAAKWVKALSDKLPKKLDVTKINYGGHA